MIQEKLESGKWRDLDPASITSDFIEAGIVTKKDGKLVFTDTGDKTTPMELVQRYIHNDPGGPSNFRYANDPVVDYMRAGVESAVPALRPLSALASVTQGGNEDIKKALNPYYGKTAGESIMATVSDLSSQAFNLVGGWAAIAAKTAAGVPIGVAAKWAMDKAAPILDAMLSSIKDEDAQKSAKEVVRFAENYGVPAWNIASNLPYLKALKIPNNPLKNIDVIPGGGVEKYLADPTTKKLAAELYPHSTGPTKNLKEYLEYAPALTEKEVLKDTPYAGMASDKLVKPEKDITRYAQEIAPPTNEQIFGVPNVKTAEPQGLMAEWLNKQYLDDLIKDRNKAQAAADVSPGGNASASAVTNLPAAPFETSGKFGIPKSAYSNIFNTLAAEENISEKRSK